MPYRYHPKSCEVCGAEFTPTGGAQKRCVEHGGRHPERPLDQPRSCAECGVEFLPTQGRQKYCEQHKNQPRRRGMRKLKGHGCPPGYYKRKRCEFCGVEYEPTTGYSKYCPDHSKGSWERNNPEAHLVVARRAARRHRHRAQFGDPDIYDAMVERYGEQCAICGATPKPDWHLAIDHCHATEAVRGLLCRPCNSGLGYFRDNPGHLRAAAAYLDGQIL